ncbi:protein FAR1-RELATED SEQUENCE 5-like [Tasmannia lanceolata]|uniref:protein FAR1-RELATED SEQUENCE 5-like n=1 Tax=Tasmannia lanceolata TaxID=3420 RepID=UPI00406483C6
MLNSNKMEEDSLQDCRLVDDAMSQVHGLSINEVDSNGLILVGEGGDQNEANVVTNEIDGDVGDRNEGCSQWGTPDKDVGEKSVVNKPFVDQVFESSDDAYEFYLSYALVTGFGVRKSSTNTSKTTNGVIWRKFVCSKQGFKGKDKRQVGKEVQERRIVRNGCKALMVISSKDGKWIVKAFVDDHSHDLTSPLRQRLHRSHNQLFKKQTCKNLIDDLHGTGMQAVRIAKTINVRSDAAYGVISASQVASHLKVKRRNNIGQDAVLVAKRLQEKQLEDSGFFYSLEFESDGTLRSMFWADRRARDSTRCEDNL